MVYFLLKKKSISAKYLNKNTNIEKDGLFIIEENTSNLSGVMISCPDKM